MLSEVVIEAVSTCRRAHDAALRATEAQMHLLEAQTAGGLWLEPLEARADERTTEAARLLLLAHDKAERAEGAARAIRIAQRGETWVPFDPHPEAAALFGLSA